jgi:hypothetical protein
MSIYDDTADFRRFFGGYVECALWSSDLDGKELAYEIGEILEAHARSYFARVHPYVEADDKATPYIGDAWSQLGHDFWLDQNGHGAGAKDGHWPVYGDLFYRTARLYPEISLYEGDDGEICC